MLLKAKGYAGSPLSHLLHWLKILRLDTYNHQGMCQPWAKSTLERQGHCREYDPPFQSSILQYDGSTFNSSENATQKVACMTQGHWDYRKLENIVSASHFANRKTHAQREQILIQRVLLLRMMLVRKTLEGFQCCTVCTAQAPSPPEKKCT